jgi:hypothetical protein
LRALTSRQASSADGLARPVNCSKDFFMLSTMDMIASGSPQRLGTASPHHGFREV